jgi:hypothetical protein
MQAPLPLAVLMLQKTPAGILFQESGRDNNT